MNVYIQKGATRHMFDALDTHGGHVAVCLLLLIFGAVLMQTGNEYGHEVMSFALGVLARSMYGSSERSTARDVANPPATEALKQ